MTAYRTPTEAAEAFRNALQLALSCVTRDVLSRGSHYTPAELPHAVFLPRRPVPLRGQPPLALEVSQRYLVEEDPTEPGTWTARTLAYRHQPYLRDGPELLAFHWHPEDPNPVKNPHLHLSAGAQVQFAALARAHIPTGLIQLQDVLRLAIQDLGVRPLRPDWSEVLSQPPQS